MLPLLGAAMVGVLIRVLGGRAHWPVILGVGGAAVLSLAMWAGGGAHIGPVDIYSWIPTGLAESAGSKAWFNIEFLIDPLTLVMLLTVTGVSTLVVIYAVGYMREHDGRPEHGYERFFAFLGLFVFSMCSLVLAGNFLLLYLGWEAVGLCSYLLIGFYYQKPEAAAAAKKAFLVNRIGDFGFGLGVLLIYFTYGVLDYETVFAATKLGLDGKVAEVAGLGIANAEQFVDLMQNSNRLTWIALLLFCGAVGKSAQIPLFVWLPDAMEGPTPVSALIHAATMVTAGVYMVARCGIIFANSEVAMTVVAWTGGLTALLAATIALAQYDLKRILAYSTVSQLGYMFLGLGCAVPGAAIFHLHTHAFFKGLLFLGAGSVIHAMAGTIDVRKLGGLSRHMPITCMTFWIGGLALAGFPLLAGFWSKDEIIAAAFALDSTQGSVLGVIGLITALMTAFYTFRAIFLTFHGKPRLPEGAHPHEQPRVMTIPLTVLAVGAAFSGYWWLTFGHGLGSDLHHSLTVVGHGHHGHNYGVMALSGCLAIVGILAAYLAYLKKPSIAVNVERTFPLAHKVLNNKWYVDEVYDVCIIRPLRGIGRLCWTIDDWGIDGIIWIVTAVPRAIAWVLQQSFQRGALQGYALSGALAVAVILAVVLYKM